MTEIAPRSGAKPLTSQNVLFAQIVVGVFLLVKIYIVFNAPPVGDEAYYWMWGQKLGLSYFDHPPLHAWLLRAMAALFGWNLFALRALTWMTLGGTIWIFWIWSKRLKPEAPASWFWPTVALYLASPMFFLMSGLSFNDHLLILLCLLAGHLFLVFAEKYETSGRDFVWLYAGATALGLAVLTKYNGVLVGLGIATFFIVHRPVRRIWRSPHLYLAALLSVAIQAPVFYWNATEGLASYRFHLSERWGGAPLKFHPWYGAGFAALTLALVGPFIFVPLVRLIRRPLGTPFADRARLLALCVFGVSTAVMGALSFFIGVYFYWNIVAYILLMPLLTGGVTGNRVARGQYVFGLLLVLVYAYHTTIRPETADWAVASTFGWSGVSDRIRSLEQEYPVGFIATTRYSTAAQLGFAMHDPEVTAIDDRHDQYDYWFDPTAHRGQDALIVSDSSLGLGSVKAHFDQITEIEIVPSSLYGITIYKPTIYLGRNFH